MIMAFTYFKQIQRLNSVSFRLSSNCLNTRYLAYSTSNYAKPKVECDVDDPNKPIKYLKSDAAKWKAQVTRKGAVDKGPWYQSYVIITSLSIFMIYFFYLREESDIDLKFNKNLYDHISGLEEKQLEIVLEYNKEHNIPTSDIEKRIKEIQSEK